MDGLFQTIQHLKKPSKKPDLYLTRSTLMATPGTTYTGNKDSSSKAWNLSLTTVRSDSIRKRKN